MNKFIHGWDICITRLRQPPSSVRLDNIFKTQFEPVLGLVQLLTLYDLELRQGRATHEYTRLRFMLQHHDDKVVLDNMVQSLVARTTSHNPIATRTNEVGQHMVLGPGLQGKLTVEPGIRMGSVTRAAIFHSIMMQTRRAHTPGSRSRAGSKGRGRGGISNRPSKGGRGEGRGSSLGPTSPGTRNASPAADNNKCGSRSGPPNRNRTPLCRCHLQGKCVKGNSCDKWHPPFLQNV